jgi:hypothetical protein
VTEHTGAGINFEGSSASGNEKAYAPLHNGGTANKPRMRLLSWRPFVKGSLRGFATVQLPIGLKIDEVPVFVGDKGGWANLPGKPILDADGRHKIDADSKPVHAALAEWRNHELADGFSHAVVAAVRQAHPDDFGAPNGEQETTVNAEAFSIGTPSDLSEGRS